MNPLMRMTLAVAATALLAAVPAAANSSPAQVEKAAASGNLKRLERLLGGGFDPETLRHGRSPLNWAAWNGQVEAARLLIAHGVDVDVKSSGGVTPLMHAVERSKVRMVRFLLETGADVHAENEFGKTALHYAAQFDAHEAAGLLLEAGADVNAVSNRGGTPLHTAAAKSGPEMVAFLLANGADPMLADEKGYTSLHAWALNGDPDTLTLLLDAGSDPLLRVSDRGKWSHKALLLDGVRKHNPQVLDTEPGRRLLRLTYEGTGCEGVIVLASDTKLSTLAERTLGKASRWKQIAEINGLGPDKSYRQGDCLKLPAR